MPRFHIAIVSILIALALTLPGCQRLVRWWITPAPFDTHEPPAAPDYADPASWAALPDQADWADRVPPGSTAQDRQARARVDVFFLHPTTFYRGSHFNAPIDDERTNRITDQGVMARQASVFNGAARIYAPRYRQIALGGYFTDDREKGLDLAYSDVRRAFQQYLARWNQGRPFFLGSHSQGSRHALRLLEEFFTGEAGEPLRERLVAAYLIGGWIPVGRFAEGEGAVQLCERPEDTGCVIGWRTLTEDGEPRGFDQLPPGEENLCTNPLLWTRGPERAERECNLGSLPQSADLGELAPIDVGLVGARCADGGLRIDRPDAGGYDTRVDGGDYHIYDYALFYMNLRENIERRAAAFLREQGGP